MRKTISLILWCLLLMTICVRGNSVPGAGKTGYRLTFYLDYHGCHLCNDKVVRIIHYLKNHANAPHVQYRVEIVRNDNPKRLKRWFSNYGLDIEPTFCEEKQSVVTIHSSKTNKSKSVDINLDEDQIERRILACIQK